MWYSVDFYKLALNFQLIAVRKPLVMGWVYSFLKAIATKHQYWKQYREENIYKLAHNGQVCYLRKALNDRFDPDLRRIYIDGSGGDALKTYIYTPVEQLPKYLGLIYLYSTLEFADDGADFLVYVPVSIAEDMPYELKALIDFYKIGGKRYLIIEIED